MAFTLPAKLGGRTASTGRSSNASDTQLASNPADPLPTTLPVSWVRRAARSYVAHVPLLPLAWPRFIVALFALIFSIVSTSLVVKLFVDERRIRRHIEHAGILNTSIFIDNNDIIRLGVGVFISSTLITATTSNPLLFFLQDAFQLIPPSITSSPLPFNLHLTLHEPLKTFLSTTTLGMQTWTIAVAAIASIGTIIPFTVIALKKAASISSLMTSPGDPAGTGMMIDPLTLELILESMGEGQVLERYWNTSIIRSTAIFTWIAILFTIPTAILSYIALTKQDQYPLNIPVPKDAAGLDEDRPKNQPMGKREGGPGPVSVSQPPQMRLNTGSEAV